MLFFLYYILYYLVYNVEPG